MNGPRSKAMFKSVCTKVSSSVVGLAPPQIQPAAKLLPFEASTPTLTSGVPVRSKSYPEPTATYSHEVSR